MNDTADRAKLVREYLKDIELRFKSGNSVSVERTYIRADEFAVIRNWIEQHAIKENKD